MLIRLLAVAIAAASMVLTGCQTVTQQGYTPPDRRDQTPHVCKDEPDCYVLVRPSTEQWVPENIWVYKGRKLVLWINNDAVFKDPPITPKAGDPPILDCSEKNKLIVKCKVSNDADPTRRYGYTINVEGLSSYDPFVWPR